MTEPPAGELGGLRELLRGRRPVLCAFATIPDPGVAAILGASGFDLVVLDAEHGPFTRDSGRGCVDALATTPALAAMRVPDDSPATIKAALDLGVEGILVPMVATAEQAAAVVRACRFPPRGTRGVGGGHASRYGTNLGEYLAEADARIAAMVTIESAVGVANAAAIAAVEGLDAIVIGPTDLAADLGVLGRPDDPHLQAAIAEVTAAAVAAGTPVGIGCRPDAVAARAGQGMTIFACHEDGGGLSAAAEAALTEARAALQT